MKKLLSVLLLFIVPSMLVLNVSAVSVDTNFHPYWDNASSVDGDISFNQGSQYANIYAKIIGYSGTTRIIATVTLYKGSGSILEYLTSWSIDVNQQYMIFSNSEYKCTSGVNETGRHCLSQRLFRSGY